MKILKITSEGYRPVGDFIPFGEYYYHVPDDQIDAVVAKLEAWRNSLGPCLEAGQSDRHNAKTHVYYEVLDAMPYVELPIADLLEKLK